MSAPLTAWLLHNQVKGSIVVLNPELSKKCIGEQAFSIDGDNSIGVFSIGGCQWHKTPKVQEKQASFSVHAESRQQGVRCGVESMRLLPDKFI